MKFFDITIPIRIKGAELARIEDVLWDSVEFEGVSHFIRCAIMKSLREKEEERRINAHKT